MNISNPSIAWFVWHTDNDYHLLLLRLLLSFICLRCFSFSFIRTMCTFMLCRLWGSISKQKAIPYNIILRCVDEMWMNGKHMKIMNKKNTRKTTDAFHHIEHVIRTIKYKSNKLMRIVTTARFSFMCISIARKSSSPHESNYNNF